jgi:hypothetical protein
LDGVNVAGTFALRRDVFDAVGGYVEALPISNQTELMWRVMRWLRDRDETIRYLERPVIDIVVRDPSSRWSMDATKLVVGTDYLLEHHADRLRAQPRTRADFLNIGGVGAARLGDMAGARRRFARAVRARPGDPRSWARLAVACVPVVNRRWWGGADAAQLRQVRATPTGATTGDGRRR